MRIFTVIIFCLSIFLNVASFANAVGANHGGGADDVIADFKSKAEFLLKRFSGFSDAERKLLKNSLYNCKIETTSILKDPVTGQAILDSQSKLAWGSPGRIQLKVLDDKKSEEDSWKKLVTDKRPISFHIIHELYRCSNAEEYKLIHEEYFRQGKTGSYNSNYAPDEGYALSIHVHNLQNYNVAFSFNDITHYECDVEANGSFNQNSSEWPWKKLVPGAKRAIKPNNSTTVQIGPFTYFFVIKKINQGILVENAGLYNENPFESSEIGNVIIPDDFNQFSLYLYISNNSGLKPNAVGIENHDNARIKDFLLTCIPKYIFDESSK